MTSRIEINLYWLTTSIQTQLDIFDMKKSYSFVFLFCSFLCDKTYFISKGSILTHSSKNITNTIFKELPSKLFKKVCYSKLTIMLSTIAQQINTDNSYKTKQKINQWHM